VATATVGAGPEDGATGEDEAEAGAVDREGAPSAVGPGGSGVALRRFRVGSNSCAHSARISKHEGAGRASAVEAGGMRGVARQ